MKWLILLVLIACGKHEEPGARDMRDSDGDGIPNYLEGEVSKYIADFDTLGKVSGVMKIHTDKLVSIPISNELNLEKNALQLIVANEKRLPEQDYFQEWSYLRVQEELSLSLKRTRYQVYFEFELDSDKPKEIVLVKGKKVLPLGNWDYSMKLEFDSETISEILSGKAYLALKKASKISPLFKEDTQTTIREKTYKVHYLDNKHSKVMYVSNELTYEEFMDLLHIKKAEFINDNALFFNTHIPSNGDKWFTRQLANGDRILVKTNRDRLRKELLENYTYKKSTISRSNGKMGKFLTLGNKLDAKVFLKLRPGVFTKRSFEESKVKKRHGHGGGGGMHGSGSNFYDCTHFMRNVKKETKHPADIETIMTRSLFASQNKAVGLNFFNDAEILEQLDDKGLYWEMKLNDTPVNMVWALPDLPKTTYVVTGEYKNSCSDAALNRGRGKAHSTNKEGSMSFVVESYVEKI